MRQQGRRDEAYRIPAAVLAMICHHSLLSDVLAIMLRDAVFITTVPAIQRKMHMVFNNTAYIHIHMALGTYAHVIFSMLNVCAYMCTHLQVINKRNVV